MEKENEKVTRRKFLEDSSRKALAGTAAAFLGLGMIKPKDVQAAGCWWGCTGLCIGCTGACTGTLLQLSTEAACGTPMEERTSSTRRVTV